MAGSTYAQVVSQKKQPTLIRIHGTRRGTKVATTGSKRSKVWGKCMVCKLNYQLKHLENANYFVRRRA